MCKEHSWDCVSGQRPVRLGFRRHEPGAEKVLGVVSARDGLCLASCCLEVNTRLFGCVAVCCWGRVSLSDRRCVEKCCGGSGVSQVRQSERNVSNKTFDNGMNYKYPRSLR